MPYSPLPGTHEITVKYAEANITGSPFLVEAIDASKVTVGPIEPGMLGQPITFPGNVMMIT